MPFTLDQKTENDAARAVRMFGANLPSPVAETTFHARLARVCRYLDCTAAGLTQAGIDSWYERHGGEASPAARATRAQLRRFLACGVRWGLL